LILTEAFDAARSYKEIASLLQLMRLCISDVPDDENFPKGLTHLIISRLDLPDLHTVKAHLETLQKQVRTEFLSVMEN